MSPNVANLLKEVAKLTPDEREEFLALVEFDEETHVGLHPDWQDEIKRRLAQIDNGEVQLIPWEQVEAEMDVLLQELRKRHAGR